jgi:hypothetical protein
MNLKIKNELKIITDIFSTFLRELFILDKNIKIGTELTNVLVKEIQYYYFNSVTGDLIDESDANKIKQKNKSQIQSDDDDDKAVKERQRVANKASYEAYKKKTKVQNNSNEKKI